MYHYPAKNLSTFTELLTVNPDLHSMGKSLNGYIDMKIHPAIEKENYKKIVIRGHFERSIGISCKEKNNKMFNYMRPTASVEDSILYINCFPGIDYVYHYGNIIKTYLAMENKYIDVECDIPTEIMCWKSIEESELKNIPKVHTVIMGYVEGLQWISDDKNWHGEGNFLWKRVKLSTKTGILLGCKHSYWGEISGRIVSYLAMNNVKRVIYIGKLGTMNFDLTPNLSIATGNNSILPNGKTIYWDNLFERNLNVPIYNGNHITVPSIIQETKEWVEQNEKKIDFVDPEIGHMALAAKENKIMFSYLHIISDNLVRKFQFDLSNERKQDVINNRKILCRQIGEIVKNL